MDQLSAILQRFSIHTEVFFAGNQCGISSFTREPNQGHLHLLHNGAITLTDESGKSHIIDEPTVLFFPNSHAHRIIGSEENPPELVCANIIYNETTSNPIAKALPTLLQFKLSSCQRLKQSAQWLF